MQRVQPIVVARVLPGSTIRFVDCDGFHREGTVTGFTNLGYSVLPTHGNRIMVPINRVLTC